MYCSYNPLQTDDYEHSGVNYANSQFVIVFRKERCKWNELYIFLSHTVLYGRRVITDQSLTIPDCLGPSGTVVDLKPTGMS